MPKGRDNVRARLSLLVTSSVFSLDAAEPLEYRDRRMDDVSTGGTAEVIRQRFKGVQPP